MRFASLVVSAWNRIELLEAFFFSLWERTTYPYELIVHDDGSQPDTARYLQGLLQKGKISTLIQNPPGHNRGHGTSVNRAVNVSEGDVIVKLNGDECFAHGWLEQTVKALDTYPEVALLHIAHYYHPAPNDTPIEKIQWDLDPYTLQKFNRNGVPIRVVWVGPGDAFAWRRSTWIEQGPWYHEFCVGFTEDMNYRLRLCPMMSLLAISNSEQYPPVTDLKAHWEKYKDTPWLAVLDPPMASYHPGHGLTSIFNAQKTLKEFPLIMGGT